MWKDIIERNSQLIFHGVVDAVPGANQFTITPLAGFGAGKFAGATNPYYAFVLRDNGGAGAAPQGEIQAITAYITATGAFTTAAFTAAVAAGDEILIIHPSIAASLLLDTNEAGGTYAKPNDLVNNTIFTFNPGGLRTEVMGIWLDLVNLTQAATITASHQIDGANYRVFDTLNWVVAMADGVYITGFSVNGLVRVNIQSLVLEGAIRNIPYYYLYRPVE